MPFHQTLAPKQHRDGRGHSGKHVDRIDIAMFGCDQPQRPVQRLREGGEVACGVQESWNWHLAVQGDLVDRRAFTDRRRKVSKPDRATQRADKSDGRPSGAFLNDTDGVCDRRTRLFPGPVLRVAVALEDRERDLVFKASAEVREDVYWR